MWDKILVSIIGLVTGGVGSFFAPWANWQIEVRRDKRRDKRELIHDAQLMIVDYRQVARVGTQLIFGEALRENTNWLNLKPYLTQNSLEQVHQADTSVISSAEALTALAVIESEVSRLKKEWKLG